MPGRTELHWDSNKALAKQIVWASPEIQNGPTLNVAKKAHCQRLGFRQKVSQFIPSAKQILRKPENIG